MKAGIFNLVLCFMSSHINVGMDRTNLCVCMQIMKKRIHYIFELCLSIVFNLKQLSTEFNYF